MDLIHVIAQDETESKATMMLYGTIGREINGHYFAQELTYLSERYNEITVKINSDGGSVLEGLSIFNAMLTSPSKIIAHIEGVAASMAGVIPMAADKVIMNDFARIMIHNPFYQGKTKLTAKEENAIKNLSQMLASMLSRRGVEADAMKALLDKESWFTSEEAKALNLIDEIINTGKAIEAASLLTGIAASGLTSNIFNTILSPKNEKMKIIATLMGLTATAEEAEIVGKIKSLQAENDTLKAQAAELKTLADQLKAEKADQIKASVESLTDKAIASGHFAKEQRESLIEMGTKSFDTFKAMIEGLKPITASLSAAQALSAAAASGSEDEKHDFEWYRRNDPHALQEMKRENPDLFNKLLAAWEKENA